MTDTQPILPAAPWYTSEVQVRAVIAAAAQLVSIALRILGKYTELEITTEMIDSIVADITQGVAVVFGILAVTKRQTSTVAPLTLTAKQADDHTRINPPLLDSDPTKLPKEAKTNA
jgi:hypothetical protein